MRTITTLWFIMSTTACAASVTSAPEPEYPPVDPVSETHEKALAACSEEPAHVTRAEYGNRPIIVDGATVYCF